MNLRWLGLLLFITVSLPVWALDFEINGVEESKVRQNMELILASLDVPPDDANDAFWRRQMQKALTDAVAPFGFYNARFSIAVNAQEIVVDAELNAPLVVSNIVREIIGEGRTDKGFSETFAAFPLKVGDVLEQQKYERFKSSMFNYALSHGYFDFVWQVTRLDLVREANQANVALIAQSGPRYRFGELVFNGDDRAALIVERIKPFSYGEPYDAEKLTEFNRLLNQSGFFQRVVARPVVKKAIDHHVPIELTIEHKPKDNYNVGIGFSTDTGLRFPLQWRRPWVNKKGHSIHARLFATEREQSFNADYRIPMQNVSDDYASVATGYQFLDDSETNTKSESFRFSVRRFLREENSKWQQTVSLEYSSEQFTQGLAAEQTTQLLMPGASVSYVDRDDELDISRGLLFVTSIEGGSDQLLSDINIVKASSRVLWINSFSQHRFTVKAEVGAIATNDFSRVPASMRFFTGGDHTIRGFRYNTIAPFTTEVIDGQQEIIYTGGRYLATASIEYAYPITEKWRAAIFVDGGTATNERRGKLASSVGFGAHYLSLVGPVRLYFAWGNSGTRGSEKQFHLSIGPEI